MNLQFHKMFGICSDLFKTGLKIYYFCQHSIKTKKWPNGQTFLFLANSFKKGQILQIWHLKRPNGNPGPSFLLYSQFRLLSIEEKMPKLVIRGYFPRLIAVFGLNLTHIQHKLAPNSIIHRSLVICSFCIHGIFLGSKPLEQ